MPKIVTAAGAAKQIPDNAIVAVSSSSGLAVPDTVLGAIGARFQAEQHPRGLTMVLPITAAISTASRASTTSPSRGCCPRTICGSYPPGPSASEPPVIWQMIGRNEIAAYKVPSGILFDM